MIILKKSGNSFAFQDVNFKTPVPRYLKSERPHIPHCMVSATAEVGMVSTA